MRSSPIIQEQATRLKTVRRHRRALQVSVLLVSILSIASVVLAAFVPRLRQPEFLSALAWVAGRTGASTGVAVDDATIQTDGRTFPVVGDTVTVIFPAGPSPVEFVGVVASITWVAADSSGAALVRLARGGITPSALPITGGSTAADADVFVACVQEDGQVSIVPTTLDRVQDADFLLDEVPLCGAGTAIVDRDGGLVGTLNRSGVQGDRLVFVGWAPLGDRR